MAKANKKKEELEEQLADAAILQDPILGHSFHQVVFLDLPHLQLASTWHRFLRKAYVRSSDPNSHMSRGSAGLFSELLKGQEVHDFGSWEAEQKYAVVYQLKNWLKFGD